MVKLFINIVLWIITLPIITAAITPVKNNLGIAVVVPVKLTWDMMFKVLLVEKYSKKYGMTINVPEFDYSLQQLNRKEVIVYGYVIPTAVDGNSFVLSKTPFSSCYFCGNGGVETVMTIKYKGKAPRYKTDDYIALKGIFELNSTDINELIYVLNNAIEVKQ